MTLLFCGDFLSGFLFPLVFCGVGFVDLGWVVFFGSFEVLFLFGWIFGMR